MLHMFVVGLIHFLRFVLRDVWKNYLMILCGDKAAEKKVQKERLMRFELFQLFGGLNRLKADYRYYFQIIESSHDIILYWNGTSNPMLHKHKKGKTKRNRKHRERNGKLCDQQHSNVQRTIWAN